MTDSERLTLLRQTYEDISNAYYFDRAMSSFSGTQGSGMAELRSRIDELSREIESLRLKMLDPEELRFEQEAFRRVQQARMFEEREMMRRLPSLAAALTKIREHFGGRHV